MVFDAILDEALGSLCGLPPGTVTAASTVMGAVSSSNSSNTKRSVEKKNTSGLSKDEKEIIHVATLNLADTAKRDHPRKSDKACVQYAMKIILLASRMYPSDGFKQMIVDAVQPRHSKCRKVMMTVEQDFKKSV